MPSEKVLGSLGIYIYIYVAYMECLGMASIGPILQPEHASASCVRGRSWHSAPHREQRTRKTNRPRHSMGQLGWVGGQWGGSPMAVVCGTNGEHPLAIHITHRCSFQFLSPHHVPPFSPLDLSR